ncbi:SusC/RagA family TonB-linked outer membrane protein [Algoriphagus machipongonensis]|uniref:Outer membrane protein, probably involved in nutrient binding n=1 Tax=Algoriphagus machipongonensis TaxID=388413 RepID=A3I1P4_9BACT|nr:TonB-dependent receptor [Algoriphagus machipongonensis]EAZ79710.1 putative outer membrane protein, probably involved in nutrient binding [Algoriphagus machipongonensis]
MKNFTRKYYLLLILFLCVGHVYAQDIQVSGTVIDGASGLSLPGVNVIEASSKESGAINGVATDANGKYSITVPSDAVLVFSFLGYESQEISVNGRTSIEVTLGEDESQLDEVVVVGYGTQEKSEVTGAVSVVKMDENVQIPATNVKNLLAGNASGLLTNQNPGLPGADNSDLSIRGFGSPLVIVDGIESYLDRLDPNDIETITVLKDASAAIYGARAGNGVILVTTKRGKAGVTDVNYHGYIGFQQATVFPEQSNAAEYLEMSRAGAFNRQYDPTDPSKEINYGEFTEEFLEEYRNGTRQSYDWVKDLIRTGGSKIASHNVSARGGSEKVRYYVSAGVLNQDGIFNGDYDYKKFNITNNLDADISKDLVLSITTSYINETRDYAADGTGAIWTALRTAQPFFQTELPDPDRVPYSGFTERSPRAGTQKKFSGYNLTKLETIAAAFELKYNVPFVPGLTLGGKVNARFRKLYNERLNKPYDVFQYVPETDEYIFRGNVSDNNFRKEYYGDPQRRILSRVYLDYQKIFNEKHKIGFLAFAEKEQNEDNTLFAQRRNLLSPNIPQISAGDDALTTTGGNGVPVEYSRISFAGRLNYAFDEKYLLQATLRADASSKFSPEVRWGYFPSISAGWNMHQENFLMNNSFIDQLKWRVSYSQTGIDSNVGNTAFEYLSGFSELNTVYYFAQGIPTTPIQTVGLPNELITWEETTLYNTGIDFAFLRGQVYGSFEGFYRKREGLLRIPLEGLPSTFGANLPQQNLDSRSDRGFEFNLGYKTQVGKVKFDIAGNFTYARQKYEKYQEDIDVTDPNQVRIDQNSGNFVNRTFGYVTDGLINSQQELETYISSHSFETLNGSPQVGDIRYVDVSGPDGNPDGVINRFDIQQIGYGALPEINFGLNLSVAYEGFSLRTLWQGGSRFNVNVNGFYRNPFDNQAVSLKIHNQYSWVQDPSNPGIGSNPNAELPAFNDNGSRPWNNYLSDFWYKDATYIRLKSAVLNYSFNKALLNKIKVKSLDLYVSGDNLLSFNKLGIYKKIIDPEQSDSLGSFTLPVLRTYTFGVRIGI